jgi:signal transduction histidine kinase
MTAPPRVIYLVCADRALTQPLLDELMAMGARHPMPLATSVAQARQGFALAPPAVILLDESAVAPASAQKEGDESLLENAVAMLTEYAPVVIIAAPERQSELSFLIASGAVDFVGRVSNFLPVAAGYALRRVRLAEFPEAAPDTSLDMSDPDFGEVLRHEVNNPLTGILGNAELLLAEFRKRNGPRATPAELERLQTIAELAVRLRETIRRLSEDWETRHHVRPA